MGRKPRRHPLWFFTYGRLKKKQSEEEDEHGDEQEEEESRLSGDRGEGRPLVEGGGLKTDDYVDSKDAYADSDSHEIEDHTTPLTVLGVGILAAGCFVGIPSCLGIPFLF